jgi:hypothetical protein
LETLRRRLPGHAQGDPAFLRKLVKSGSLLIMIDAVHEASVSVQERLVNEVESLSGGRFLLTTQPVVRIAPKDSTVCEVLPLRTEDVSAFLLKQGTAAIESMGAGSLAAKSQAFSSRVRAFLDEIAALPFDDPRAESIRRMLSNPLEAVLAAEILAAGGDAPVPGRLLAQRIAHIEQDYAAAHGEAFPAMAFASHLCACRLSGAPSLSMLGFEDVAALLARHRLLRKGPGEDAGWRFRHDKIMDWFLLPALSPSQESGAFPASDPRFATARELVRRG